MFSKLTFALAMATTAEAVQSFYPKASDVKADFEKETKTRNGGTALAQAATCQACLMAGGEFVMTAKAEFTASAVAAAKAGKCCTPGKYASGDSICDITPTDAMKKSSVWAQPEMALANCPNLTTTCEGNPVIDLDAETTVTRTVGKDAAKMVLGESCAYIATSKCKAPTVNVSAFVSKETGKDAATARTLWDLSYFEYTVFDKETDLTVSVTAKEAMDKSTDRLGGEMWPVQW